MAEPPTDPPAPACSDGPHPAAGRSGRWEFDGVLDGLRVLVADRDPRRAEDMAAESGRLGSRQVAVVHDHPGFVAELARGHGRGSPWDAAVWDAGLVPGPGSPEWATELLACSAPTGTPPCRSSRTASSHRCRWPHCRRERRTRAGAPAPPETVALAVQVAQRGRAAELFTTSHDQGTPRLLVMGAHPNHTVQTRALHAHLRWRNANARHPDLLAAQRKERARVRSEKNLRWGGRAAA